MTSAPAQTDTLLAVQNVFMPIPALECKSNSRRGSVDDSKFVVDQYLHKL